MEKPNFVSLKDVAIGNNFDLLTVNPDGNLETNRVLGKVVQKVENVVPPQYLVELRRGGNRFNVVLGEDTLVKNWGPDQHYSVR